MRLKIPRHWLQRLPARHRLRNSLPRHPLARCPSTLPVLAPILRLRRLPDDMLVVDFLSQIFSVAEGNCLSNIWHFLVCPLTHKRATGGPGKLAILGLPAPQAAPPIGSPLSPSGPGGSGGREAPGFIDSLIH